MIVARVKDSDSGKKGILPTFSVFLSNKKRRQSSFSELLNRKMASKMTAINR